MKKAILLFIYMCIFYCIPYITYATSTESSNAFLEELRIDYEGIVPKFEKDIYKYYLTVSEQTGELDVFASAQNPNSTIEISGNTNLKDGLNIITITVISEDRTQNNIYTIEVTRTDNIEFANTNLEILAIENVMLSPPFDTNITNYDVEVSNEIDKINILAIPQNENAKIEIAESEYLQEGNNFIDVNITAQNGFSKKTYTINVYKRSQEVIEIENENYNAERTSLEAEENQKNNIYEILFWGFVILAGLIVIWYYTVVLKETRFNR